MSTEHLTEQQVAQCADAMAMEEFSRITPSMRAHIAECDQCADEVNTTAELVRKNFSESLITALGDIQNKKSYTGIWLGVAAALVIILGIGYLFKDQLFYQNNQLVQTQDSTLVEQDSAVMNQTLVAEDNTSTIDTSAMQDTTQVENLIAFQENQEFELLVDRYRDGNLRDNEVKVVTPADHSFSSLDIELLWELDDDRYVSIEIFNNKGEKIESIQSNQNSFTPKTITTSGLYYWKMTNEDFDLLFCGRIKVEF